MSASKISHRAFLLLAVFSPMPISAQTGVPLINVVQDAAGGSEYSLSLEILVLMTVLTLLPSIVIMMTSFVRIIIGLPLFVDEITRGVDWRTTKE